MSYKRYILITFIFIPLLMMTVFIIALQLLEKDWIKTDATINSTTIKSSRPGTPAWSLMADITYQRDGQSFSHQGLKLYHHQDRQKTVAEAKTWPIGKRLVIYTHPDNPESISLASDGDRQTLAVVAAILSPMALIIIGLGLFILRRWRKPEQNNTRLTFKPEQKSE
ncbi:MAG: hypothetical protein DHS20C08_10330 [Rhodomicrobium sp.]|nr:MAG: hypothetical protein DHS20C08_10330 [Rhodomicrobium sp.]